MQTNSQRLPASGFQPTANDVLAARRELARRDLKWFVRMIDIPGAPLTDAADEDKFHTIRVEKLALHHEVLLAALQEVGDGKLSRLIVLMPPGSAKSTYVSVVFPAWLMARRARTQLILASYGSDLARKHGRRARQVVTSKSFATLFDAALSSESSAADEWALTNGSEYMSGGLLSGMTGNRADGIITDDPVKGRQEAESATFRARTLNAYTDDLCTRLKPGGFKIIMQTRWHEADLTGSILPEGWSGESGDIRCRDGDVWRVICIPAKADRIDDPLGRRPGEYLWPEWFPPTHWRQFESNGRTWASLFQQKPAPEEGTYFQRAWFKRHETAPAGRHVYITSDYAVSEGKGDYTEHAVWGYGADDSLYQLDWWHGQTAADEWIAALIDLIKRWKPLCYFGEQGVIEKAVRPMLVRAMRESRVNCRIEWVPSIADKASRARAFQARAAMGKVSLLSSEAGERVLNQLLTFPAGKFDDAVDVCSLMGLVIDQAHPGVVPVVTKPKPRDAWDEERESGSGGWKVS